MEKILKGKSSIMYVYRNKSTGDFVDEDGVPVTTTIYVPKEYKTEFEKYLGKCRFTSCRHINDKGCEIVAAVESGEISESRHNSYIALYNEAKDIKEWEKK